MNAPATPLQQITLLPIGNLFPSPTNPRTRFNEAKLRELSDSIKHVGIAQPLLVRAYSPAHRNPPSGKTFEDMQGHFEIVAGERRFRAATLAGLQEVPCYVRELDNQQVLHLQLIENLQRDDLHPIEEAEGYERLMQQTNPATGNPYTADDIAAEIGMSRSHVFQRRKLLSLCEDARKACFDGKIDASTALLIARIPVEKLQLQALKEVSTEAEWSSGLTAKGDKMSYRRARDILQEKFMLDLDRAIFDPADATLLPKAGNCTACPKRTGNAPDLFDDVGSKDVCTDTVCFGMKKAAHVLKLQKEAENTGAEFIAGKAAKKLLPNNWSDTTTQLRDHGYATLDTPVPGDKQKRTIGQLLEENKLLNEQAVKKTIVANPHREGQTIETVNIEVATKALREAGFEITLKGKDTSAQSQQDRAKQEAKNKAKLAQENTWRARLFDTLHEQIEAKMPAPDAAPLFQQINAMLAEWMFSQASRGGGHNMVPIMRKYAELPDTAKNNYWWPHIQKFGKQIKDLTPQQHSMLMIDLLSSDETELSSTYFLSHKPETMLQLAELVGIDAAKIKREVAAEAKAAAKPAKPEVKKPAAKAKPAPAEKKSAAKAKPSAAKPAKTKAAAPAAEATKPASTWPFPEPGKPRAQEETATSAADKKTASTPTPAAQAQGLGAETKPAACWPFPTPNYSNVPEKKTRRKAAAAA